MEQHNTVEIQFRLHPAPRITRQRDAQSPAPIAMQGRLPRVTHVLALAIHFQEMIRKGEVRDYADLARLGCLTRERISQIMKLVWLAPDIQIELLYLPPVPGGRYPISEVAVRKITNVLDWPEQRAAWVKLKQQHKLA
ncbi:MAG TPA: hypothetical protein VN428_01175 [Bryobacteraceae bacterium]|nr:hypothetical protein [Bryobacteraceae bacterium]